MPLGVSISSSGWDSRPVLDLLREPGGACEKRDDPPATTSCLVVDAVSLPRLPKRLGILTLEGRNLTNDGPTSRTRIRMTPERYVLLRFTLAY